MHLGQLKYLIKSNMNYYFQKKDIELLILKILIRIVIGHHSSIQLRIFKILIKNLKAIMQK